MRRRTGTVGPPNSVDVQSQFIIGRLYATGQGAPLNLREAARWFLRAAEQGHATAAFNIAVFCSQGTGVEQDTAKAIEWYKTAADRGISGGAGAIGQDYTWPVRESSGIQSAVLI